MDLKLKFWKKDEKKEGKRVVLDQKSLDIGSALGELNQKFDKLSTAVGQCFLALDKKIETYKDNIIVIQDGISKQIENQEDLKRQLDSYEKKILRLLRNLRFEVETEIHATKDHGTKKRLRHTLNKIDTSLILSIIKERGPIETKELEEEVLKNNVCSRATLFRRLRTLREKGAVFREGKEGTSFYSISPGSDIEGESRENSKDSQA